MGLYRDGGWHYLPDAKPFGDITTAGTCNHATALLNEMLRRRAERNRREFRGALRRALRACGPRKKGTAVKDTT